MICPRGTARAAETPVATQSRSYTLPEVVAATLGRNEDVATARESVVQAEENYSIAKAALFPSVNLIASLTRQDVPTVGIGSAISPAEQRALRLNLSQPLFRGFREYAGLRQQSVLSKAAKSNREQAELQLYLDVSDLFFQLMLARREFEAFQQELDANQRRRAELLRFRKLGRSRATDLLSLDANLATLEAQLEQVSNTLKASETAFKLLTGIDPAQVELLPPTVPSSLPPVDQYLQKLSSRPDLLALEQNATAADEGIKMARGGHWPSLDLNGNYYFQRPGVLQDVKWDIQLALTFPIFQGGAISSQTAQAVSLHQQAELALDRARREAKRQIETWYLSVLSDRIQVQKQNRSVQAWKSSQEALQRDYALGVVNNLEVLQSLTNLSVARRNLARAEVQLHQDFVRLKVSTGEKP